MFDHEFQSVYKSKGIRGVDDFPDVAPSIRQCRLDVQALYGAIRAACSKGMVKPLLMENRKAQDGLTVWMELVEACTFDGDMELRKQKLEIIINRPYHRHWKGGVLDWVQSYINAFVELTVLGVKHWKDDQRKKDRMLANAFNIGIDHTLLTEICKEKSFKDTCLLLQSREIWRNFIGNKGSNIHEAGYEAEDTASPDSKLERSTDVDCIVAHKCEVSPDVWKKLPQQVQKEIIQARIKRITSQQNKCIDTEVTTRHVRTNQIATDDKIVIMDETNSVHSGEDHKLPSCMEQAPLQEDVSNPVVQMAKVLVTSTGMEKNLGNPNPINNNHLDTSKLKRNFTDMSYSMVQGCTSSSTRTSKMQRNYNEEETKI